MAGPGDHLVVMILRLELDEQPADDRKSLLDRQFKLVDGLLDLAGRQIVLKIDGERQQDVVRAAMQRADLIEDVDRRCRFDDCLDVGDQFGRGNWDKVQSIYQIFYFSINFGSFFATLLIPAIRGDGKVLWEAKGIRGGQKARFTGNLDVRGVKELVLVADLGKDLVTGMRSTTFDYVNWGEPILVKPAK